MAGLTSTTLAEVFHKFPHLDFNFRNTTTIFTPDDERYQQALLFNGIYLLFAAVTLFLVFTTYFLVCSCYFCGKCIKQPLKPRPTKSRCLRLLIAFFAICSCAGMGLGFYGNNKVQDGVDRFASDATQMYDQWDFYGFKNMVIGQYLESGALLHVQHLIEGFDLLHLNISPPLLGLSSSVLSMLSKVNSSGNLLADAHVSLNQMSDSVRSYDNIRWWITLSILCWHLLLALVVLYSSFKEHKCPFIGLTMMSVLSLFFMMTCVSFEVPLSVGAADICLHPDKAILQYVPKQPAKDVVGYYLYCPNSTTVNLLIEPLLALQTIVEESTVLLDIVKLDPILIRLNDSQLDVDAIQNSFTNTGKEIRQFINVLGCSFMHNRYKDGVQAVCSEVLDGLGLLILSALIISLFNIFTLLCITPIWKAMAPLKSILRRPLLGVHIVTASYQGPPGEHSSLSLLTSSSFEGSYKSLDEKDYEHVPLINPRRPDRPPSYRAIQSSTEFLSVEEENGRHVARSAAEKEQAL